MKKDRRPTGVYREPQQARLGWYWYVFGGSVWLYVGATSAMYLWPEHKFLGFALVILTFGIVYGRFKLAILDIISWYKEWKSKRR